MADGSDRLDGIEDVARRLREALGERSITWFQGELEAAGVGGSKYSNVQRYVAGKGKSAPPLEWIEGAARTLGVRAAWLAFEDGAMTAAEEAQWAEAADASRAAAPAVEDLLAPRLRRRVLEGIGLPPWDVERGASLVPSWVAPLAEVWLRLVGAEAPHPEAAIGRALRGPIEALGIDVEELEAPELADYVLAMVPALLVLADERGRQGRAFSSYVDGLPEDERRHLEAEREARQEAQRGRAEGTG